MAVSKTNFFKEHYDWLVAVFGLALLAGAGFLFAESLDDTPEAAKAACEKEIKAQNPRFKDVPKPDEILNKLKDAQKQPMLLDALDDTRGSFLASERRVRCQKCRGPIPDGSKVCMFCNFEQKAVDAAEAVRGGNDTDGDGLPDAWELKYGLNPNNGSDAKKDSDGDTFTNLEEYEAKTDPTDPDSHPNFLDFLAISGPLKVDALKFWFERADATSRNPKAEDWRITFVLQGETAKEMGYDSKRSAFAKVQAEVGKEIVYRSAKPVKIEKGTPKYKEVNSGWRVLKYNKKEELVLKPGTEQKVPEDVSTVELERISDKRTLTIQVKVKKPVAVEEQVDLAWSRGDGKPFTVTKGSKFKLKDREYEVKMLAKEGNGCKVTIVDLKTKEEKIIQ